MKTLFEEHDIVEGMVRGMIKAEVSPVGIMIGVHNAFSHGECLTDAGLDVPEEALKKLFDGLDVAIQAMKEIEEASGLR